MSTLRREALLEKAKALVFPGLKDIRSRTTDPAYELVVEIHRAGQDTVVHLSKKRKDDLVSLEMIEAAATTCARMQILISLAHDLEFFKDLDLRNLIARAKGLTQEIRRLASSLRRSQQ